MNAQTQRSTVAGPAGAIEVARDPAQGISRGLAFVSHPHPLFGGTLDNKVVQTLARAFNQSGWDTVRYNFRGVGESAGSHDGGRGELEDLLCLIDTLQPQGPLCLAGFSFGAFITGCACARLHEQRAIAKLVLVGTATGRFVSRPEVRKRSAALGSMGTQRKRVMGGNLPQTARTDHPFLALTCPPLERLSAAAPGRRSSNGRIAQCA